jgi:hypothetical protein
MSAHCSMTIMASAPYWDGIGESKLWSYYIPLTDSSVS